MRRIKRHRAKFGFIFISIPPGLLRQSVSSLRFIVSYQLVSSLRPETFVMQISCSGLKVYVNFCMCSHSDAFTIKTYIRLLSTFMYLGNSTRLSLGSFCECKMMLNLPQNFSLLEEVFLVLKIFRWLCRIGCLFDFSNLCREALVTSTSTSNLGIQGTFVYTHTSEEFVLLALVACDLLNVATN